MCQWVTMLVSGCSNFVRRPMLQGPSISSRPAFQSFKFRLIRLSTVLSLSVKSDMSPQRCASWNQACCVVEGQLQVRYARPIKEAVVPRKNLIFLGCATVNSNLTLHLNLVRFVVDLWLSQHSVHW